MASALATDGDVETVLLRPLTAGESAVVDDLLTKASAKLRQACPFDIDARIALFATDPTAPTALDPNIVADVVATIIKRLLLNPGGVASSSEGMGPFSRSATYVNRYDKSGQDVRGAIQVIDSDIDQLRPAQPTPAAATLRIGAGAPPREFRDGEPWRRRTPFPR